MATTVQIRLTVDEQGAVTAIGSFGKKVQVSSASVKDLGNALKGVNLDLKKTEEAAKGVKKIGEHALTSLDNVRLLRDDLGIRIPRSMEKAIAQSKVLSTAIKGIGTGLLAFGAVEIGISVAKGAFEGLKKLWDEHLSVTKAAADYRAEVEKTRQEEFGNTSSIEDTTLRINAATEAIKKYHEQAQTSWWMGIRQRSNAHDASVHETEAQKQLDELNRKTEPKQFHEERLRSIDLQHALDAELKGKKAINAETQRKNQIDAETVRYEQEMARISGNPVASDSGASELRDKQALNARAEQAKLFNLQRENSQEMMRLREQANEAGLKGSVLYAAQEKAAIDELRFSEINSAAAVDLIHKRFHAEQMARLADEQRETRKIQDEARIAGLTGMAKVQAQGDMRVGDIASDPNLDAAERDKRIAAVQEQTAAEVAANQITWTNRVDQVIEQSQDRQLSGFARIRAEAEKAKGDLQRQFDEAHNGMDISKPGAQGVLNSDMTKLGAGFNAIDRGSDYQQAQLAERNAQETLRIEEDARRKSLSAMKQQTAAIAAEYDERVQRYQEQLRQQEISEDDYNRRVAAAAQERDAEMVEAAKAAREKMAGEFTSLFRSLDHPMEALARLGEKAAGEVAAGLVQKLQQRMSGTRGNGQSHGLPGSLGTFFDHWGKPHGSNGPGMVPASEARGNFGAAQGYTIASAIIRVGTASIAFGGGSSMPPSSTGGGFSGGGFSGSGDTSSGGAGDSALASPSYGAVGGAGAGGGGGSSTGGIMGDVSQGLSLGKSVTSLFKKNSATTPGAGSDSSDGGGWSSSTDGLQKGIANGGTGSSSGAGSMMGGGGIGANAGGAISGGLGLISAYQGNGGIGGALQGGLAGFQLGMAVGGPIGAAIGAAGGMILGGIGFGGREKARVYDLKTVRPKITGDTEAFEQGSMDYMSAYQDLQATDWQARVATGQMGPAAHDYYNDTIKKELKTAEDKLTQMQKGGRSMYGASTAQYATGTDFVPRTEMALVHKGERIFDADSNKQITRALTSPAALHASYQSTMRTNDATRTSTAGHRTLNMSVQAFDSRDVARFFDKHKHIMRGALNDARAENSGGGVAS